MTRRVFTLVPLPLDEANAFVAEHHRHHPPVVGCKFALGAATAEGICAVAIVGRPVARGLDDGWSVEITRLCVAEHLEHASNAASWLLGRVRRAAGALGYRRIYTYTLASETGVSLRAAGFRAIYPVTGRSWTTATRPRVDKHPTQDKIAWEGWPSTPLTDAQAATLDGLELGT